MRVETITKRDDLVIRRHVLEPGEATAWHTDACRRFSVVVRGEKLRIEFRETGEAVDLAAHPGLADWDEPEARVHRGVNAGPSPYEEIVTFFLDPPGIDPQPEHPRPSETAAMVIRAERESDHGRVDEIHRAAFGRHNEACLVERLRRSADPSVSLVAEKEGRVLGHVFFSPVRIESAGSRPAFGGLAPVAVDPARQRRGIGSALVRAGLEECRKLGWRAVFLVGDPSYYSRFGFALASARGFGYGDPRFDPVLQVLELEPGALRGLGGGVRFDAAFAQTGTG